jgi:hypothetical protein
VTTGQRVSAGGGLPLPDETAIDALGAAHLRALAGEGRPAGSDAAAGARRYCAGVLQSLGFEVTERPFHYSAAVGEFGTPAAGAAFLAVIAGARGAALGAGGTSALAVLVVGALVVMLAGRWAARHGVLELSASRRQGMNLEARRHGEAPALWLVAHVDSKSQPISLVVRAAGIVVLIGAWIAALVLAADGIIRGEPRRDAWLIVVVVALAGAVPVIASTVGKRSAGAVDNASGVAAILAAASLSRQLPLGVLITDAEELGLAGARAWCAGATGPRVPVVNCDSVDDRGALCLMWTRPRAAGLEALVRDAAEMTRDPLRVIPLIPGVLVDGLAFSDAGWEVVTLSRGSVDTLRRIHTRRDDLAHLRGDGIDRMARVLARAATLIVERR